MVLNFRKPFLRCIGRSFTNKS